MNALRSERGSVALGGLTKLLIVAVIAVVVYDGVAIGYARYSTADHGAVAADAAGEKWRVSHDIKKAYHEAEQKLAATGETIDPATFSIAADDTVSFDLHTKAPTLLAQHIGFTRDMTVLVVHIQTSSVAP